MPEDANVPEPTPWVTLGQEVLDVEIEGLRAVRNRLDASFAVALDLLAACRGRLILTGLGKSGLVARKAAATFSSTGTPAFFLHPVEGAHGDLGMIRAEDVVLAISNSGETDELNGLLPALRSLCAGVVALTGRPESSLGRMADVVIHCGVPREACPMNLAPTSSTTAALAVTDALAVCLMRHKDFGEQDFARVHPAGALGRRLKTPIREIMHTQSMPEVLETSTLGQALEILNSGGLGTVLLTDAVRRLTGILTDGDVRRLLCKGLLDATRPVAEVMTSRPSAAQPHQSVAELLDIMESRAIMVLPIVDASSRLLGVVHLHDLLGKGRLRFTA